MRILIAIILGLSVEFSLADGSVQSSFLSEVVAASKKESTIKVGSGEDTREITFRDGDPNRIGQSRVEPVILLISKVVLRNHFPELREVNVLEARDAYAKYIEAVRAGGNEPELHLWLSKETDEAVLRKVLTVVCPKGASNVWIQYFESGLGQRIPPSLIKPTPPKNQRNPALQDAPFNGE